jgi:hypothetical protein
LGRPDHEIQDLSGNEDGLHECLSLQGSGNAFILPGSKGYRFLSGVGRKGQGGPEFSVDLDNEGYQGTDQGAFIGGRPGMMTCLSKTQTGPEMFGEVGGEGRQEKQE